MVRTALSSDISDTCTLLDSHNNQPSSSQVADHSARTPCCSLSQLPACCEDAADFTLHYLHQAFSLGPRTKPAIAVFGPAQLSAVEATAPKVLCEATCERPKSPKKTGKPLSKKALRKQQRAKAAQEAKAEAEELLALRDADKQAVAKEEYRLFRMQAAWDPAGQDAPNVAQALVRGTADQQAQLAAGQHRPDVTVEQMLVAAQDADTGQLGPCTPEQQAQAAADSYLARPSAQGEADQQSSPAVTQVQQAGSSHHPLTKPQQATEVAPQQQGSPDVQQMEAQQQISRQAQQPNVQQQVPPGAQQSNAQQQASLVAQHSTAQQNAHLEAGQQASGAAQQQAAATGGGQQGGVQQQVSPGAQQTKAQQQASLGAEESTAQQDARPQAGQQASGAAQQQAMAAGEVQQGGVQQFALPGRVFTRDERGQGRVLCLHGAPGIGVINLLMCGCSLLSSEKHLTVCDACLFAYNYCSACFDGQLPITSRSLLHPNRCKF